MQKTGMEPIRRDALVKATISESVVPDPWM